MHDLHLQLATSTQQWSRTEQLLRLRSSGVSAALTSFGKFWEQSSGGVDSCQQACHDGPEWKRPQATWT